MTKTNQLKNELYYKKNKTEAEWKQIADILLHEMQKRKLVEEK